MKYIITALVVLLVGLSCIYQVANADSAAIDWTSAELSKKESEFTNAISSSFGLCKSVNSIDIVSDMEYVNGATLPYSGCIIEGKDVDMYISPFMDISPENPRNFAIRTKPNGKFYFLKPGAIASIQYAQLIPGTNMYTEWRNTPSQRQLVRTMDIRNAIRADRFDSAGNPIRYVFDDSKPSVDMYTFRNIGSSIIAGPITKDGKVIFWSGNGWLYKTSLETGVLDVKYMTGRNINWQNVPYHSNQIYPVDSAGQYVYLGGKLDMLVDTADCGQYYETVDHMGVPEQVLAEQTNCKMRSFKGMIGATVAGGQSVFGARFEGNKLQFGAYDFSGSEARRLLAEFYPEGVGENEFRRLKYLAIGDSYSSGEGDIDDDGFWYRQGTAERDGCHSSIRSYPYLLKQKWNIIADDMKSIACSGAKVSPDYYDGDSEYFGQRGELKGKTSIEKQNLRTSALANFTPGIIRQVDFVEKYKPTTLTLTAGGNDIGFGEIISYCATPKIEMPSIEGDVSCAQAYDPQVAANLRKTIDDERVPLTELINKIREASPETKVYLVGYPQFVALDGCVRGSELLDRNERRMIRSSVTRLNNILKLVARDTDIHYVNVENSLEGGQICQGSRFMTGPLKITDKIKDGYSQEAYHPNAKGHERLAEEIDRRIKDEDLTYTIIDIPPEENGQRVIKKAVTNSYVGVGSTQTIEMGPGIFNPDGTTIMDVFSKKIHLGTYKIAPDGSLSAKFMIPTDIGTGNHLLTLTGQSVEGDTIQVQQYITVYDDRPLARPALDTQEHEGLYSGATKHKPQLLVSALGNGYDAETSVMLNSRVDRESADAGWKSLAGIAHGDERPQNSAGLYVVALMSAIIILTGVGSIYVKNK